MLQLLYSYHNFHVNKMKNIILKNFGDSVRELRIQKKMTQEELANKAGLHRTYIGMIERAEKNITLINIQKIANALSVEISNLLYVQDQSKRENNSTL